MAAERIERTMPSQATGPSAPENFRLAEIIDVLPSSEGCPRVCGAHSAGACNQLRRPQSCLSKHELAERRLEVIELLGAGFFLRIHAAL